jgi:beta-lactamase regulating signal transducer with metallopeptidase domain
MNAVQFLSGQPWVERLGWTLVQFLWQGTLIAGLYAIARRRLACSNYAQVRYVLACVTLAAMVAAPIATFGVSSLSKPVLASAFIAGISRAPAVTGPTTVSVPFESLPSAASPAWRDDLMPWLVMAWFAGAIALWLRLIGGWAVATRMRSTWVREVPTEWKEALDVLRARVRVSAPVRMLISALVQVPTVVGWLRPAILLPIGALTGLAPEHITALLIHELAHIRRRDYLINVLQSVAEALLFYHPAVWWVSSHIRTERELCCDDVAVAIGGDTLTYVDALAGIESRRPEHLTPSLAADGGSLPDRIARLLGQTRAPARNVPAAGMLVCGILIAISACGLFGQAADTRPAFEVASLKPDSSETVSTGFSRQKEA